MFLKTILAAGGALLAPRAPSAGASVAPRLSSKEPRVTVFRSVNGSPGENVEKVVELLGGIERIVGPEDVVIVKPNVQWWNQGATNLSALKTFVDLVFGRKGGFRGEVVLAENCHRGPNPADSNGSGWGRSFERNSDLPSVRNTKELALLLKKGFGDRFSLRYWINVGSGARRVFGPEAGEGYVFCDGTGGVPLLSCDNGASGGDRRETIMTYPIFTTDKGTVVDFRNGIWEKGAYTGQPLKFVNFPALNHHSTYCGVTSAVKNYMGITDLSGGPDPRNGGRLTEKYYNFHSFPFDKWAPGPRPGMLGKAIGTFMATIRMADLNITAAEWVGLSSRVATPVARTRAILASADPVALDYHAAKYVLYLNSEISVHDPDRHRSPVRQYLERCAEACGAVFDERFVSVTSYDFAKKSLQRDDEMTIVGSKEWGADPKGILRYLYLRMFA